MSFYEVAKIEVLLLIYPGLNFIGQAPEAAKDLETHVCQIVFFATLTTQPDGKIIIIMIKQQECSRERVFVCVGVRVRVHMAAAMCKNLRERERVF